METPQTESGLKYYPLKTRTNIQMIDVVLDALSSGDAQALIKLFGYSTIPCMTSNALGGPPACRQGEPEGTIVEVLPVIGGEGSFLHKDEIDKFPGLGAIGLYAIFEVSAKAYSEANYPGGDYGIVLVTGQNVPVVILQTKNRKIVRIDYVLAASSLSEILKRDASTFILESLK